MNEDYAEILRVINGQRVRYSNTSDVYHRFRGLTKDQVMTLHDIIGHYDDRYCYDDSNWLESTQNYSPRIGEFLQLCDVYKDRITLHGYVILPPRFDYRVSIEGFEATRLTADEGLSLVTTYHHADSIEVDKTDTGYCVYAWWD